MVGEFRDRFVNLTEHRLAWIATALSTEVEKLPFRKKHRRVITWRGAAAYRRDLAKIREQLEDDRDRLVQQLRAANLLPVGTRPTAGLRVSVVVKEYRKAGAPALPAVRAVRVTR